MNNIINGQQWITFTYEDEIPEKRFCFYGDWDSIGQTVEEKVFEFDFAGRFAEECQGYLTEDRDGDMTLQSYTPLSEQVYLYNDKKSIVKQIKAINDALTGKAWTDDCCIVDLAGEFTNDLEDGATIDIRPFDPKSIDLPQRDPDVVLDYFYRPLRCNAFKYDGRPKEKEKWEKDEEQKEALREACLKQMDFFVDDEYELYAVIGTKEIAVRQPFESKIAKEDMRELPIDTPDLDNVLYAILKQLDGHTLLARGLRKFHIYKRYINKDDPEKVKIWINNLGEDVA